MPLFNYLQQLAERIDWPNVFAGYLIAIVPMVVPRIISIFKLYTNPQRKKYLGDFYIYHWSGTQQVIRTKKICFSYSWDGKIKASLERDNVTNLAYDGYLLKGAGEAMYMSLTGEGHNERVFIVFYDPLNPYFEVTRGIIATVSLNDRPTGWKMILARNTLEETIIQDLLGRKELLSVEKVDFAYQLTLKKLGEK